MTDTTPNAHKVIHLSADSASLPPGKIRVAIGAIALIALSLNLYNIFHDFSTSGALLLICTLAVITAGLILLSKHMQKEIELTMTDTCIKSSESSGITRTAYFSRLHSITLTASSIVVKYTGWHRERFIIPAHSNQEYQSLKDYLQKAADDYSFSFKEKYYWF